MAAAIHYITRTATPTDNNAVDGIQAALYNTDDGDTDAAIIAALEALIVAAGSAVPSGYFDTVAKIGLTPSEILATDQDFIALKSEVQSTTS